jgi:hypothetical protein
MAVVEPFRCNDEGFKRWLDDNPDGYVLNCYATGKVHSARCPSYQSAGPRVTFSRPKACSASVQQLFKYAAGSIASTLPAASGVFGASALLLASIHRTS